MKDRPLSNLRRDFRVGFLTAAALSLLGLLDGRDATFYFFLGVMNLWLIASWMVKAINRGGWR